MQDLRDLATFARQYRAELSKIAAKPDPKAKQAAALAGALEDAVAKRRTGDAEERGAVDLRDRAATHLLAAMREIRAAGAYVFRSKPEIAGRFRGAYDARRRARSKAKKAAQGATVTGRTDGPLPRLSASVSRGGPSTGARQGLPEAYGTRLEPPGTRLEPPGARPGGLGTRPEPPGRPPVRARSQTVRVRSSHPDTRSSVTAPCQAVSLVSPFQACDDHPWRRPSAVEDSDRCIHSKLRLLGKDRSM